MDAVINNTTNYFSTAIILVVCFIASALANYLVDTLLISHYHSKIYIKSAVLLSISPIVYILAFTIATYLLMGKNKKSIPTLITGFSISTLPYTLMNIVNIASMATSKVMSISYVFWMLTSTLRFVSCGLMFYFISELLKSENGKDASFRKTIIIVFVSYVLIYILQKLGLYSSI